MITVGCRHGVRWDGPEEMRPDALRRRDRLVAEFRPMHTVAPDLRPEPLTLPERHRWELFREGVEGAAVRGKRGTWSLRCPYCGRNLPVPERRLFRLFDVAHWSSVGLAPGAPLEIDRERDWDTTLDLASLVRANA